MARAAAIFRWQGNGAGTKTAFDDGRNWVDTAGTPYAQAQYPSYDGATSANVNGDTIWYDTAATTAPAGYDLSAKGDLAGIVVGSAFDKAIASSGTPLLFDMQANAQVQICGTNAGAIYLKGGGTQGLQNINVVDMKSGSTLTLDGDVDNVRLLKGTVVFSATLTISSSLYIGYINNKTGDVTLTIPAGVTPPASVYASGGTVSNSIGITTLIQSGGIWTQALGTIGNLILSDGKFIWNAGTLTAVNQFGGTVDGSQSITPRTATAWNYYKGTMNFNNSTDACTVTALNIMNSSPDMQVVIGQKLAI